MTNNEIRANLHAMADGEYKKFIAKLTPNINPDTIMGIRMPQLRAFAKTLAKADWQSYLTNASDDSFEEIMLQGLVIGGVKAELNVILPYVAAFLPKIDNWAVCDSFSTSLKLAEKYPAEMWDFIMQYQTRFTVVTILDYYIREEYLKRIFAYFDSIKSDDYYIKMAVAWAVAECYVKLPDGTLSYLENNKLDDFTHNKAVQKIRESRKIDEETRKFINKFKR